MSIDVTVVDAEGLWTLGLRRFEHLPSKGDRVVAGTARGLDIWEVLFVEHGTVLLPVSANADPNPYTRVIVRHVETFEP